MIIINKNLVPKGFAGITLFPFIIFKTEAHATVKNINHEKIHIKQQLEMLVIPFFIWYGIEYLIRIIQNKDTFTAYKKISFEQEAYDNQTDLGYLNERSLYSWFKYLKR